ncbi:hypothetical protein D3C71_2107070 [compost metagenome]
MIDLPFQFQIQLTKLNAWRESRFVRTDCRDIRAPGHHAKHISLIRMLLAINHRAEQTIAEESSFVPANRLNYPFHIIIGHVGFPINL